ncbi:hypothetical protein RCC89_12230 [Cytophagaceae bacterium ABcell3]|nr:hypothetical protein RCC89_12230 [Cytophagaceae bacterium ABcell3]
MNIGLTTLAAFSLGAMHALEPGHGKTFITSYLLTGRSSKMQLFIMGLSMALSHTLVLFLLGLMILFFSSQTAGYISDFLLIGSPSLVIGIGLYMLYRLYKKKVSCGCSSHSCSHGGTALPGEKISSRTAALVGFTGGLLPCPSAIAVFSLSGTTGDSKSALCMMGLYVVGFILIMAALIIGASFIKNKVVSKYFNEKRNLLIQKISAYAIILTGVLYLTHNIVDHL